MLLDTCVTLAYKCSACGTFDFFNISLFEISGIKEYSLTCRCGKSSVLVSEESKKSLRFSIPCISCGNKHILYIDRKHFLARELNLFYCPQTGMQLLFIGNDLDVRKKVDTLEKELDELIDLFGYESYFKNTQVMFDSLNKIHDLAEEGNLYCECGSNDIELTLLSDKIHLRCKRCSASKVIYAASNEDLKDILGRRQILLLRGGVGF